nr:hypothetical protein [uncultured Flavobacterium sp.]
MKKLIYLLTIVFISSCEANIGIPENKKVYYKLNSIDFDRIPTKYSQLGNINIYKNSIGESIEIKNILYKIDENIFLNGELFGTEYYNDRLFIRLNINGNTDFDFYISKYENDLLSYKIIIGQIFNINLPKDNNLLFEKNINNILYKKVTLFELSKEAILNINNVKINKIYFDLKGGVVGLEDSSNNNQFWITN